MTKAELRSVTALLQLYTQIEHISGFFKATKDRSFAVRGLQGKMSEQIEDVLALSGNIDGALAKLWRSILESLQRLPDGEARLTKAQVLAIYFLASHTWYSRALGDNPDTDAERKRLYVTVHPPGFLIEFYGLGSKDEANPEELIATLLTKSPWWKFWK